MREKSKRFGYVAGWQKAVSSTTRHKRSQSLLSVSVHVCPCVIFCKVLVSKQHLVRNERTTTYSRLRVCVFFPTISVIKHKDRTQTKLRHTVL
jgi:hypothetical protein